MLHMLAQHFAQGFVHQVGGAVVALGGHAQGGVDVGDHGITHVERAGFQCAVVTKHIGLDFLGVADFKQRGFANNAAFVADLAAALTVKRGGVQHDHAILAFI